MSQRKPDDKGEPETAYIPLEQIREVDRKARRLALWPVICSKQGLLKFGQWLLVVAVMWLIMTELLN